MNRHHWHRPSRLTLAERRPTAHDRCTGCGDPIDPENFGRDHHGFQCVPCDDDAYAYTTTAHEQDLTP